MAEEEKRFKVLKKISYEEQISKENKRITMNTFAFGLASIAAVWCYTLGTDMNSINGKITEYLLASGEVIIAIQNLKVIVGAITRKTILDSKIEDINNELDMLQNEESKGMGR